MNLNEIIALNFTKKNDAKVLKFCKIWNCVEIHDNRVQAENPAKLV